jgi:N-formylglutamate amidohydrolase
MSQPSTATSTPAIYRWTAGDGPIVATAIHAGHEVRPAVAELLALSDAERLREEDPYTDEWVNVGHSKVVGLKSRFEVDLNRAREQAVYQKPEDAWGLNVWKRPLPREVLDESLSYHAAFYERARLELDKLRQRYGRFVVLDLHSYNHRRAGSDRPPDDPNKNPEINVGTGGMDRSRWGKLVDRFMKELHGFDFQGRSLDVRENVRFKGGYFAQWVHTTFPESGCAWAIEVKKFFMDEWTGKPDREVIATIGKALQSTVAGILRELQGGGP